MLKRLFILGLLASFFACQRPSANPRIPDFRLLDHRGVSHQLSRQDKIWLLSPQSNPDFIPALEQQAKELDTDVDFFFLHERRPIDWPSEFPVLLDPALVMTELLQLRDKGDVVAVDSSGLVLYRGRLEDLKGGLRNGAWKGDPATGNPTLPTSFPEFAYAEDVAGILQAKCQTCHRDGQVAPFSFDSYEAVRSKAGMIKEVILTGRMPPWQVGPSHAFLQKELSLSPLEKRALVSWLDQGAPRGKGLDPLPESATRRTPTSRGEPDIRVVPDTELSVPAEGNVPYQYIVFDPKLPEDTYIKAIQFEPDDARAVHHAAIIAAPSGEGVDFTSAAFLQHEVMSLDATLYGHFTLSGETGIEDCGFLLPAGSQIILQLHLNSYGKVSSFRPSLGLYLSSKKPKVVLKTKSFVNVDIRIPAGAKEHTEVAEFTLREASRIHGFFPHMHYRGERIRFLIDGETVLNVPNYDFNWQFGYWLKTPMDYPAGTTVRLEGVYNNSADNPQNPDPSRDVPFGIQSEDEMLYGSLYLEEKSQDK